MRKVFSSGDGWVQLRLAEEPVPIEHLLRAAADDKHDHDYESADQSIGLIESCTVDFARSMTNNELKTTYKLI